MMLFAWWARLLTSPLAAVLATGILASAGYSIRYAVEIKPYSYDLLASLMLLIPATLFIQSRQSRWLIWLTVAGPFAMIFSYPAIFIAGAIAFALALETRKLTRPQIILAAFYAFTMIAIFIAFDLLIGKGQHQYWQQYMDGYWKDAFPPANPLRLIWWLIVIHTGRAFPYPLGDQNGGSTPAFLLGVIGLIIWLKNRPGSLRTILLAPFALTFIAAALHKYPYGGSARVAQHLAPMAILFIGTGGAFLIQRFAKKISTLIRCQRACFACLICIGSYFIITDFIFPYHDRCDFDGRQFIQNLLHESGPDSTLAIYAPRDIVPNEFQW
jgi:hypothetical protein